ncbi:translocation/assembly module TamB [Olivibacter sp. SDN3]|uniref:translocation/assembly module TamB domain-containing protein n=1 Tax=Olivibacter sp. SDN3 TaxID=2764720 RepID=UPI001650F6A9|nr:translocation/assembly module TamB domain-containing protein [Olivibacter sp. SDN3]QNL49457.1 translocation/assembly module TamB [Olivibacter sp. SDN3]
MNKVGRIALKTVLWIIGSVIGLTLLIFILIRIPAVQNFVVQQVVSFLEKKIETPVKIARVSLDLPKLLVLEGVYFEDQKQDTLFSGDQLKVDISLLKLLNNKVEINEIDLRGITAKIDRTLPDSSFNFDYIVEAFAGEEEKEPKPEDTTSTMEFSIDKINLDRIRFVYKDDVIGTSADFNLAHFDTRIKTFDLNNMRFEIPKINIKGINTAVKQWAVAQAADAPSPEDLGVETATSPEPEMPDLKIGSLNVEDIKVDYDDEVGALQANLLFKQLLVDFNEIDLKGENIDIKRILLDENNARIAFGKTAATSPATTAVGTDTLTSTEPMNWKVKLGDIELNKNRIAYFDANQPRVNKGMDYGNLDIQGFDLKLADFFFAIDSISGQLKQLNFKDRSGLAINRLETDFVYTEHGATLGNLHLETPHTLIRDYVKISYASLETLADEIGALSVDANVKRSKLGMQDVVLLVPDLDTMEVMQPLLTRSFNINGRVVGRVDDLRIPNIEFSTLDQTKLQASAHIKGLPDVDKLYADLQLKNFTTGKRDLDRLIAKSMLPDSIDLPQHISLRGDFKGGMNSFNTDMHLLSSIGKADLNAKYQAAKDTTYDATVAISDINVGELMKMDSTLGKVSFTASVKGTGLDPAKAIAAIQAKLISAEAVGYTYTDINLNAKTDNGNMEATLASDDPNIDLDMQAFANLSGKYPSFKMDFMVDSINTKNLNLTEDSIRFHGQFTADFETADPDFLNGQLDLTKAIIAYNNDRYVLDTISIIARADSSQNLIQVRSEFLDAHMIGSYKLTTLANAFQNALVKYYNPNPEVADASVSQAADSIPAYPPTEMEFGLTFRRSPLIIRVVPDLTELQPVTFDGNFNSETNTINVKGVAPKAVYAGTEITNVSFDINTFDSTLYYAALINNIKVSSIELTNTLLSGTIANSLIDAGLWIKDRQGKEQYYIGANLLAEAEDFIFRLKEDGLMLNYDQWSVNPENAISFGKKGLLAYHFDLTQNGQQMNISSQDSVHNAPLALDFKDFRIETFTNMIESNTLVLGGGIDGNATVERLDASPVFTSDININNFYFGTDTIGDINLQVSNAKENTFTANIGIQGNGNDVQLSGDYVSPPNAASSMDFVLAINNLNMSTIEAFSLGNLRRTAGSINGSLAINGTPDAPRINGDLIFDQARMNISMLNATFSMDQQRINFNNNGLAFKQFTLTDSVGNSAVINGAVNTKTYTDFTLAMDIKADDFQVLNATEADNDLFYGKLFIDSDLRIRGAATSPSVNGTLRVNGNTDMTLTMPESDPGLVEREGIVEFTSLSSSTDSQILAVYDTTETTDNAILGMNISLNIDVDKDAAFTVIVDPGTGDQLFIKGQALLNFGITPGGEMTLAGTYTVEEGNYSLSFNMIKRRFDLKKGSTIVWGGDVMHAQLDMTAIYRIQAQPIDLVQNQVAGSSANYYRQRLPFDVNLHIGGEMMKPEISFDIDLGEGGNASTIPQTVTQTVESKLAQLRDNPSEMNKQTFALIVLGRFIAENPFHSAGGSSTETMVRSSVSSLLTSQLNKLAGDLIAGVELNFDLQSTADDYSTGQAQNRTDLNVGLSKRMLDDRLKVTVGSNFELEGAQQPGQNATNIAGDISLEYQLSRDGRYVARVYRKNQYQVTLQGQFIETGLGFIINMSYDEFKELFMSARRLQQFNEEREKEIKEQITNGNGNGKNNDQDSIDQEPQQKQPLEDDEDSADDFDTTNHQDDNQGAVHFNKAYNRDDEEAIENVAERTDNEK